MKKDCPDICHFFTKITVASSFQEYKAAKELGIEVKRPIAEPAADNSQPTEAEEDLWEIAGSAADGSKDTVAKAGDNSTNSESPVPHVDLAGYGPKGQPDIDEIHLGDAKQGKNEGTHGCEGREMENDDASSKASGSGSEEDVPPKSDRPPSTYSQHGLLELLGYAPYTSQLPDVTNLNVAPSLTPLHEYFLVCIDLKGHRRH